MLHFQTGGGWVIGRHAFICHAYDGRKQVTCVVSAEYLDDTYGGHTQQHFDSHRAELQSELQHAYGIHGVDVNGEVVI